MNRKERENRGEKINPRKWTFKGEDLESLLADYGSIAPGKSDEYFATIADEAEREKARIGLVIILGIRIGTTVEGVKRVTMSESSEEKGDKYKIKYTYRIPSHRSLQRRKGH